MRAAGCNGLSESFLGEIKKENRVIIEDGVAKLPDRSSFAGSIAVGDDMTAALCGRYNLPLETVSHMLSAVPAKMLGLKNRGEIKKGYDAELVILDKNYKTKKNKTYFFIIYLKFQAFNLLSIVRAKQSLLPSPFISAKTGFPVPVIGNPFNSSMFSLKP